MALLALALVVVLLGGGPAHSASAEMDACGAEPVRRGALTSSASFYVEWWPECEPIPLNQMFAIHFLVLDPADRKTPISEAVVTVSAWMPEHNHGTTLQPRIESHGDGTATAQGILMHMEGKWQLRVGVAVGGQMERASFDIRLEP